MGAASCNKYRCLLTAVLITTVKMNIVQNPGFAFLYVELAEAMAISLDKSQTRSLISKFLIVFLT